MFPMQIVEPLDHNASIEACPEPFAPTLNRFLEWSFPVHNAKLET
jgi:hypothetical protein